MNKNMQKKNMNKQNKVVVVVFALMRVPMMAV